MPLHILKASAGSGKTFSLARTYIEYCLDPKRSIEFQHILAITFTKKATAEMKNRILEELYILSTQPSQSKHFNHFITLWNWSEEKLKAESIRILHRILSGYHFFSISTIDRFFSGIYQNLALDLFHHQKREIYLNTQRILENATVQLLDQVDAQSPLADVLIPLIEHNIKEGKGYRLENALHQLGKELFKDEFTFLRQHHIFQGISRHILEKLQEEITQIDRTYDSLKHDIITTLDEVGMSGMDFIYGKNSFVSAIAKNSFIEIYFKSRFQNALDTTAWFKKNEREDKEAQMSTVYSDFYDLVKRLHAFVQDNFIRYNTYTSIIENYQYFMLLSYLDQSIDQYLQDQQLITLNEINRNLHQQVQVQDAPIIFEKLGQRYHSILIDEFQDTSVLQWHNLQPLIEHNLYDQSPVLIVGDVKQSIYRFRDGDWRIMAFGAPKIQQKFNDPERPDLFGLTQNLPFNWRSAKLVVETNNTLYTQLSNTLSAKFQIFAESLSLNMDTDVENLIKAPKDMYADTIQKIPEHKKEEGYVLIEEFEQTKEEDTETQVLEWLEEKIIQLSEYGITGDKIGILCYRKKEIQTIGAFFSQKSTSDSRFLFSAGDSLIIGNNDAVRLLMAALKIKFNLEVEVNIQLFETLLLKIRNQPWDIKAMPLKVFKDCREGVFESESINEIEFVQLSSFFETLISRLHLTLMEGHFAFLLHFLELVKTFEKNWGNDVFYFISEWEKDYQHQSIELEANPEAIQLMTVHKSKGLEFHTVLLPYVNWEFESNNSATQLWTYADQDPLLKEMGLIPVQYQKRLGYTYFAKAYFMECVLNIIDNLNLMYVATTRAKNNLLIRLDSKEAKQKKKEDFERPVKRAHEFFNMVFPQLKLEKYEVGQLTSIPEEAILDDHHRLYLSQLSLRQQALSIVYRDFQNIIGSPRHKGLIFHQVLSYIQYNTDIDRAIRLALQEGIILSSEIPYWETALHDLMQAPQLKHFFTQDWKVHNEKTVILPTGEEFRPDRVMEKPDQVVVIDFKTGQVNHQYHTQVAQYVKIMEAMINKPVQGYLLYLENQNLVAI